MDQETIKFYGRESFMEAFKKKLLDSSSTHYLLSAKWGSDKTTIVKHLVEDINRSENAKAIYIDAWENDSFDDPNFVLINRLFEEDLLKENFIESQTKKKEDKSTFQSIKKPLFSFVQNMYDFDLEELFGTFKSDEAHFYLNQISKMEEQKFYIQMLEDIFEKASNNKYNHLIFFIDELDRAKPDFTVRLSIRALSSSTH